MYDCDHGKEPVQDCDSDVGLMHDCYHGAGSHA